MWFALPLVFAETCAYVGLILFTINMWKIKDTPLPGASRIHYRVRDGPGDAPPPDRRGCHVHYL